MRLIVYGSMADMAAFLLSGSWALIFLDLGMYAVVLGLPIAFIVWLRSRSKNRLG